MIIISEFIFTERQIRQLPMTLLQLIMTVENKVLKVRQLNF